ncbi:MAG: ABC transporter permease [Acidobacteriota bacterium]
MPSFLQHISQDIRFGTRILLRTPSVTVLVVFALALGIGANSAMFSVVDALLLHPLSYQNPDDLVMIFDRDAQGQLRNTSAGNLLDWRSAKSFEGVAGVAPSLYVVNGMDRPVQVPGARVTANIFQVLGVKPLMGRTFLVGEDGLDGSATVSRVAVISFGLWRGALGSDPNVLGRTIRLNDAPFAIVGVMQPEFELLNRRHQIWVPAVLDGSNRDYRYLRAIARRRVAIPQASSEMASISQRLTEAFPSSNRGWAAQVEPFRDWLVDRRVRNRLLILFAAVGLVLLLACSNVASLLLARSSGRKREIALRISMGATRSRIVMQLLTESVMLSVVGGALGLALAGVLIEVAPSVVPASAIPTTAPLEVNVLVIAFAAGISLLTGLVFGLAPAVALSRPDVQETLQDATRGSTGGRARQFFRQSMVTVEVAVALVLLAGAMLMVDSLQRLSQVELGVNTSNVLTQRVFLPATSYDAERSLRFHREVLRNVSAMPGMTQVAMGSTLPLAALGMEVPFDLESAPVRPLAEMPGAGYTTVSPGYFAVLQIPLLGGREFGETDSELAPPVAVVNAAFAARYFPKGDAVGNRLRMNKPLLGKNSFANVEYVQIVGVVGNVTMEEIGIPPMPLIYAPMAQNVWSTAHWLAIRTSAGTSPAAAVRKLLMEMDPSQPVDPSTTLEGSLATQFAEPRFQSRLMAAFALLALALAVVGIYGVNSYAVTLRRREIGVRMALGASPQSILRSVVGQGMRLTLAGIVLGLAGAIALNSTLNSLLVGVGPTGLVPLTQAAFLLIVVAAAACYLPARRATRIDPAITLRRE